MKRFLLAFSITVLMVFATNSSATDAINNQSTESLLELFPELQEPTLNNDNRASRGMSCLIDTPAFDFFVPNFCIATASAPATLAFFRIDGAPANFRVLWSDSRCSPNRTSCVLTIFQRQPITMNATVLDLSNNTFFNASATALYEGFQ